MKVVLLAALGLLAAGCRPSRDFRPPYHEPMASGLAPPHAERVREPSEDRPREDGSAARPVK